ncbi:MAG: hypothetical protein HKN29_14265 [Rhodothermales bacterium]|nr:hypothetical protein [Rhodothermales bacterium]
MRRRSRKWRYIDPSLTDHDVALDALADALSRSQSGRFNQVASYFQDLDWEHLNEEELVTALRRFVFRKVEDGVYRMFQERDPQLAKLIRVLRNAANSSEEVSLVRHGGRLWVCVDGALPAANVSTLPLELLERRLWVCDGDTAPDMLKCVVRVLRYQTLHQAAVPLTGLALVVRAVVARAHCSPVQVQEDERDAFEWSDRVNTSVDRVCDRLWSSYEGQVAPGVYAGYRKAAKLVYAEGYPQSAAVARCVEGAEANYREAHRKVFEYIARKVRADLQAFYRSEVSAISLR